MKRLLLVTIFITSVASNLFAQDRREILRELQKFGNFIGYINQVYVDTLNNRLMIEDAIRGVLSQLDPHSTYITAEDMKQVEEDFNGNFEGIGVEYSMTNDTIIVINTISGGPSAKVGILPNDKIVKINGNNAVGLKLRDVPKYLRGPKGSVVNLGIIRNGVSDLLEFKIVRDKIPIYTFDATYKVNDNTGYIRINRFSTTTNDEMKDALNKLSGIKNLIVDLRGNGGGLLNQAILISSQFINPGKIIVSTEGKNMPNKSFTSVAEGKFRNGGLCIIVDETSASASEIVAGAIQDWDRGIIIGRPTFGKGLVQQQIPLPDGSAVRITTARYHTPSGRVIQRPFEKGKRHKYQFFLRY